MEEHQATVRVSGDQVSAAQALIRLRGGADKVDPLIVKIAAARPDPTRAAAAS